MVVCVPYRTEDSGRQADLVATGPIQPTPRSCGTVRSGKMPIPSIPTGVPILKTARSSKSSASIVHPHAEIRRETGFASKRSLGNGLSRMSWKLSRPVSEGRSCRKVNSLPDQERKPGGNRRRVKDAAGGVAEDQGRFDPMVLRQLDEFRIDRAVVIDAVADMPHAPARSAAARACSRRTSPDYNSNEPPRRSNRRSCRRGSACTASARARRGTPPNRIGTVNSTTRFHVIIESTFPGVGELEDYRTANICM